MKKVEKIKKIKRELLIWTIAFPLYLVSIVFFFGLRLFNCVVIHGWKNIPFWPKRLIIVSNHPSLWEPVLLNYLYCAQTLIWPFKFVPYSTPDLNNYNKWYWDLIKGRFIFVPRQRPAMRKYAFRRMREVLEKGKILILFPEGGRTGTNGTNNWLYSASSKNRLRPLTNGATKLAFQTDSPILIVWVKGSDKALPIGRFWPKFWKRTDIFVGSTINLVGNYKNTKDVKEGTKQIAETLLALADETEK